MEIYNWLNAHWLLLIPLMLVPFVDVGIVVSETVGHIKWITGTLFPWVAHIFDEIVEYWTPLAKVLSVPFKILWNVLTWVYDKIKDVVHLISASGILSTVGNFLGITGKNGLLQGFGIFDSGDSKHKRSTTAAKAAAYRQTLSKSSHSGVPWASHATAAAPASVVIHPAPVVLTLDGRTVARSTIRYMTERAARGPQSLSGGSLVTGASGPSTWVD